MLGVRAAIAVVLHHHYERAFLGSLGFIEGFHRAKCVAKLGLLQNA
jgi:hypothetical protein